MSVAVNATERPRDFAPYDLTLFCVKAYDTDRLLSRCAAVSQKAARF